MSHWKLIEADLHEVYGIDVESKILRRRTGRWLRTRIQGLRTTPCRLQRALAEHEDDEDEEKPDGGA